MLKTVLVLLIVVMVASACASNDTAELDVDVDTPPLRLVHVDEGPTPTTTFTEPVVGPGGPQERNDTSSPPPVTYPSTGPTATYPSTGPDGGAVTDSQTVALGLMLCGTGLAPVDFTNDGEPDSCLTAPQQTQLLDTPIVVGAVPDVCPDSELFIEALTTVSDDGCRPVSCVHGWGFDGYCIQQLASQVPPGAPAPNPTPDASADPFPPPPSQLLLSAERQRMIAEDFGRVAVYLTEAQDGCRPWADTVTNRCVLDTQDGLQLCFGWVTTRNSLGWEPCPRRIDHDGTGRPFETITDNNPLLHLRHDIIYGTAKEGLCTTSDCAWTSLNDPATIAAACARYWRLRPHLTPGYGGLVCGPLDGCTRWYDVAGDRCVLDGVLWCHFSSGLWRVCAQHPAAVQPSGVPCPSTADADWVRRGRLLTATFGDYTGNQIVLTPGVWRFTLCVRGNHQQITQSVIDWDGYGAGGPGFEVRGPRRFDFPGPNGDTSFDGWAITPHHTDPGTGDCPAPASDARYTHMFCAVSVDDWDHHRVMTVTSTGQNPPFLTHLSPSNRRFQSGYWEITATRTN